MRRGALLVLLLCGVVCGRAAEVSLERQGEILHQALEAFDAAVAQAASDPDAARQLYEAARAGFEALVQVGVRSAALEYNLGNTYYRLGSLGRAIVHYRRAERMDPTDEKLLANLDYARRQVEPAIRPAGQDRLLRHVLFLHYSTSLRTRFWAAAALSALGWLGLTVGLLWRTRHALIPGLICIALGLSFAASAGWQIREQATRPAGVVVGQEVVLRLGRGNDYEPALQQPLGPGVELEILLDRGDWVEVRLRDHTVGWLPASAVERV